MQAAAVDFNVRQTISYARCAELFSELFGCPISQGTLAKFVRRAGARPRRRWGRFGKTNPPT